MASRSGPGAGVYITVTILGVSTLTLFALTIVFASKYQNEHAIATDASREVASFVTGAERANDEFLRMRSLAQEQSPPQSAMGYLVDSYDTASGKITGVPGEFFCVFDAMLSGRFPQQSVP